VTAEEIPYLLQALEADPGNWNTRRYIAEHHMRSGEETTAASLLTTAPNAPDTEDHCLFAARVVAPHSTKRAHHILDSFLVHHASSARVHYLKGKLYQVQGSDDKAATHFKVAMVVNPNLEAEADALLQVAPVQLEGLGEAEPVLLPQIEDANSQVKPISSPVAPAAVASVVSIAASDPLPVEEGEVVMDDSESTPDVVPFAPAAIVDEPEEVVEVAAIAPGEISPIVPPSSVSAAVPIASAYSANELANLEATGPIIPPSEAAESSVDVVHAVEAEGDGESDDLLADIVSRQTAMVAAMADTSDEVMEKPLVKETKSTGEKVSAIAIAIIAHLVILLLLGLAVMAIPSEQPPQIYAAVSNVDSDTDLEKSEVVKPTTQKVSPAAQQLDVLTVAAFSDVAMPTVDVSTTSDVMGMSADQGVDFGTSFGMPGGGAGMSNIPPSMAGRCSMGQRMARLKESGATTKCEGAVRNALRFLKNNQNEDGSFGKEFPVAMTSLCILAYLGHCETPDSVEFGQSVVKATNYLMQVASKSDHPSGAILSPKGGKAAYENGIAAYALAEMYTMTKASGASKRIPKLESTMKKSIKVIIEGQGSDGGWVYGYGKGGNGDASVSGWQFQAMKAAHNTGENIGGLDRALDKGVKYFMASQAPDGSISYRRTPLKSKSTLAGVGALAFEMWGAGDSPEAAKTHEYLVKTHIGKGNVQIYDWYYTMQAFFLEGGEDWTKWNEYAMQKILEAQIDDGSFARAAGGHGPKEAVTKNIYATALCTLMLEVYYRYLPTTQKNFGN
jgi:hypothetical protein